MHLLDDSSNDQNSVGSALSSFQSHQKRGFFPHNSISSFHMKDLEDLEFKEKDVEKQGGHSAGTASPARKPVPKRGVFRTYSFRLSRRSLADDGEGINLPTLHQQDSRGSRRNLGLKKPADKGSRFERTPFRNIYHATSA